MNRTKTIIFFVLTLLVVACGNKSDKRSVDTRIYNDPPIPGDSSDFRDVRMVDDFDEILIYDVSTTDITLGQPCRLEIKGPKNYVEQYLSKVEDKKLTLGYKDHDSGHRKIHLSISAPSLDDIDIRGCSKFTMTGQGGHQDEIDLNLLHVVYAQINSELSCDHLNLSLQGVTYASVPIATEHFYLTAHQIQHLVVTGYTEDIDTLLDNSHAVDFSRLQH